MILRLIRNHRLAACGLFVIGFIAVFCAALPTPTKWRYTKSLPSVTIAELLTVRLTNGEVFYLSGSLDKTYLYDPVTGDSKEAARWKVGDFSYPRLYALTNNRAIMLRQGFYDIYDPASNKWTTHAFSDPKACFMSGFLMNDRFVAFGGVEDSPHKLGEIINLHSDEATPFNGTEYGAKGVKLSDNEMLCLDPPQILNMTTLLWRPCKPLPFKADWVSFIGRLSGDRLLCGVSTDSYLGNGFESVYDIKSDSWTRVEGATPSGTTLSLRNGVILSVGGSGFERSWVGYLTDKWEAYRGNNMNHFYETTLTSCQIFDPVTTTWHYTYSLNSARSGSYCLQLEDGRVLVLGGEDKKGLTLTPLFSCEIIDEKDLK